MKPIMLSRLARARAGFTLLETLIAMVIIAFGVMVLANAWSGNVVRLQKTRINATIANLLQRKMTEVEIAYRTKPLEVPEEEAGDFGSDFAQYRWELRSKEFEPPDMSQALIAREGGADEMTLMMVRTVTDFIKESVKEVTVTVIYKGKVGRELRNSVTTYFIDYTKEIPMGALGGGAGDGNGGGGGGAPGAGGGGNGGGGGQ